jgi:hypothetical protein
MTGVTPRAGAGPQCEDGPGAALAGYPSPWSDQVLLGATASTVIGRVGSQAAGLALRLSPSGPADMLDIAVVDERGSALLRLGPFAEEDVIAVWRALGAASGLPLMIEDEDGRLEKPFPQVGRVHLGPIRIRRRHGLLNGRRPRFLVRRKTTRLPQRPLVHREREMFAREQA